MLICQLELVFNDDENRRVVLDQIRRIVDPAEARDDVEVMLRCWMCYYKMELYEDEWAMREHMAYECVCRGLSR